jgi:hypothetical protein
MMKIVSLFALFAAALACTTYPDVAPVNFNAPRDSDLYFVSGGLAQFAAYGRDCNSQKIEVWDTGAWIVPTASGTSATSVYTVVRNKSNTKIELTDRLAFRFKLPN